MVHWRSFALTGTAAVALLVFAALSTVTLPTGVTRATPRMPDVAPSIEAEERPRLPVPGGSWTRNRQPYRSLIAPAQHLDAEGRLSFFSGFALFRSPWVVAPSSTTARDGLGPLFNAHSCEACHREGGRGASLADDSGSPATVLRIGRVLTGDDWVPHPVIGSQVQPRSTYRKSGEGIVSVSAVAPARDPRLRQLHFRVESVDPQLSYEGYTVSARVAPPLIGMGLLESIPDETLRSRADPEDMDGDGVSGRTHERGGRVGRFGWKALHPTSAEQVGSAFRNDMGLTSARYPDLVCTAAQQRCRAQRHGDEGAPGIEVQDVLFDLVVHFVQHIPPPKAGVATDEVLLGQKHFHDSGCASCHQPSYETAAGTIWPYTDLLLHDMGSGLADGLRQGAATGREWRTPPLWAIGTMKVANGVTTLLHDGRARSIEEAVLWHGGEADSARLRYEALTETGKRALARFVRAL